MYACFMTPLDTDPVCGTTSSTRWDCEVICGQCICLWVYVTILYIILKISTSLKVSPFLVSTSRAKEVKLTIL